VITERATKLRELCKQYVEREQERRRREDYERLRDGLKEAAATLFPSYSACISLRELGAALLDPQPSAQARQLKVQAAESLEKFAAAPSSLVGTDQFPIPAFKRAASAVAKRMDEELLTAWVGHIKKEAPAVPEELVILFARIPGKREAASEVGRLAAEVDRFRDQLPRDRHRLDAFRDLMARLAVALRNLFQGQNSGSNVTDMPAQVRDFIEKASTTNGAPIEAATREVIEWLRGAGIISAFVVRTAATRP
jgi:hypothetical protein